MEAFLGTILAWSFTWAPMGWAICDGRCIPIQQNQALFSLIGYTYGGTTNVNFALPDLRGRFPLGRSVGVSGRVSHEIESIGGDENVMLTSLQVPLVQHTHNVVSSATGSATTASVNMDISIPVNTDTYDVTKATNTPGANCTLGQGKAGNIATNIYTTSNPTTGSNLKPFTAQGSATVPAPTITVTSKGILW